jgi:hypothetical protein
MPGTLGAGGDGVHHAWALYHAGWALYDAAGFVRSPSIWTAVPVALAVLWFVARPRRRWTR